MGFLDRYIQQAQSILGQPVTKPVETESVIRNDYDRRDWSNLRDMVPMVNQQIREMDQTINYAEDLAGDLFATLFKMEPTLRDRPEMMPTHVPNREIVEELLSLDEVRDLRRHTAGDVYSSAMGMQAVHKTVSEVAHRAQEAAQDAEAKRQEAEAKAEEMRQAIAEALEEMRHRDPNQPEAEAMGQAMQAKLDQFGQQVQAAEAAAGQAQQAAQQAAQEATNAIRMAAKKADQDLQEEAELMSAFGVEDGQLERMNVEERMQLARMLKNNRLAAFTKILGQWKIVQQAESRKRVINASSEVHSVTLGNDLTRMATSEMLAFADETTEMLLFKRWAEGQLVQYDVRGKEKQGQGPIVVVCDESWSMTAADVAGGTREAWSKGLALAMCDQAKHRGRDFWYIGFSSARQQHVIHFPGGKAPIDKVVAMTEHFWKGGTNYEEPLRKAMKIVLDAEKDGLPKPDIVLLSDEEYGEMDADFMKEWNRVKDKTSMKCYGVAIGCSSGKAMYQVCDNVRAITELVDSDPRMLGDLFRTI